MTARKAGATVLGGRYEIVRELGRGATSIVHLARDRKQNRDVALKVIRVVDPDDDEADTGAQMEREARILARLHHPNIVRLLDTLRLEDGRLALVMEYVRSHTLKSVLRDSGPLPIHGVERVLRDVASALDYAYGTHAIVHRDVKPENIWLEDERGRALLSDFGIARVGDRDATLTLRSGVLGTPAYMSPEQIDGGSIDGRSDLYSLGMVAYELLTGRRPWDGENLYTVIYKQKHGELQPIHELRPDTPPRILRAVDRLLCKSATARWSSAGDFIAALSAPDEAVPIAPTRMVAPKFVADAPPPAVPAASTLPSARGRAARGSPPAARPRGRRMAVALGLVLLVAVSGVTVAMIRDREPAPFSYPALNAAPASPAPETTTPPPTIVPPAPAMSDPNAPASAATTDGRVPGSAARVVAVSGDGQRAVAGGALAGPITVRVEDADGAAVPDVKVAFRVVAGDGNVIPAEAMTDWRGQASAAWAVGAAAGRNELNVVVSDRPQASLRLSATGVTGPPAAILLLAEPQTVTSPVEPGTVAVRVEDRHGNPVAGARVEFRVVSGNGSVATPVATTAATGVAQTTWTMGSGAANRIAASVAAAGLSEVFDPPPLRLSIRPAIAAGGVHTCVLGSAGDARCWGGNDQGQLGSGSMARPDGRVRATAPFAHIAAGISHTCALDRDATAFCWGVNGDGQLGTGDRTAQTVPAQVRGGGRLVSIVAGLSHTCALAQGGAAVCWGAGSNGQLGNGSPGDRATPAPVAGDRVFRALAAGWRHTCGLTAQNTAWCWGANASGQLGDGTTEDRAAPAEVAGGHRFSSISAGASHTCGLTTAGAVLCWGQNDHGQIGGPGARSSEPRAVAVPGTFASIAAGAVHTCGLGEAGAAFCWGRNNFGQLGNGTTDDARTPVAVNGDVAFSTLSASGSHTCGRTAAGSSHCWGYNVEGQLGDGTRTNRLSPVVAGGAGG